ncbi:laminin subunit alpha isoform X1 [Vespa velutina]|uniref:laminin subunit alpha isoform X1 n=1 Tax=Vespa velutina TaxID=202808 RepID=UPI001FB3304A|nr:laminin subunit alpha isoform X1 [Vespa velutina]XP_047345122.1 laminin subunit alpha isoform X1 [Vespa velutina]XP_047345123.1 laminin subunit alpha isoform X1 [Vespa velutina]
MSGWWLLVIHLLIGLLVKYSRAESLTPPYFNLAEGKDIIASATCGVDTPGPELYCKLVGANADQDEDINLIQGQVCDVCDPDSPEKKHPPEYAVDGMETWWQSPPLSRGMKYNEVNLTINLGQEFHVAYVYVRMGNSPRPELWVLEKSTDYGKTWLPWQYFADSDSDCLTYFGVDSHKPITRDDSVICTTEYSKIVPLEGGEIPISILNNRPSAKHYFNSTILQEWTRATNVRFRFLRTKNLLGHLMSVVRQDPTVTRRYFYSIKDISIGGRCMCNGHADTCDIQDPTVPNKLVCRCQHNTCGPQCTTCCKGFEQKKWQQSTSFKKFMCEPCNCFGHSDECTYNSTIDEKHLSLDIHGNYEGGGVCKNCRDNTEGINCNQCKPKFYRPENKPFNATDVCQPCNCDFFYSTGNCADATGKCECRKEFTPPHCDTCNHGYFGYPNCRECECHLQGTNGYHCEAKDGPCPCKTNYAGHYCNLCAESYYNFPECLPCECNSLGSLNNVCDVVSGNCTCKNNYGGRTCSICEDGYFNYPSCTYCNCDARGTKQGICDKSDGVCLCKEGYGGSRCDQCINGYYGYPNCRPCNCSLIGSSSISCDSIGKCSCLANFAGKTCDQCSPGYYMYPECIACNCDSHGAIGVSCDTEGKCQCRENFDGSRCNQCKEGFYNFPTCEGCNCDPAGIVETFQGCGSLPAGELCQCKDRVEGRICNKCKPLYWNLQPHNTEGCEECQCNIPGVIGSIGECDVKSGQCICKPGVTDRSCTRCIDGTYNLQENNLFGCSDCNCDIGGSVSSICDKQTGQCQCQPRVTGLTCKEPLKAHYFPTLHQFQYEVEDGRTSSNSQVRYGFLEEYFPGYSWKGYAVFSALQDEIIQNVYIYKSSLYRMVIRYVNPNNEPILGTIKITPDSPVEVEQQFKVQFKPTTKPSFVTVAGIHDNHPSPMVMNPGHWTVSIANKKTLFVDYFVLLPSEYYEATILTQDVNIPCKVGYKELCRHYGYPNLMNFDSVRGAGGFLNENNIRIPLTEYFSDKDTLREIDVDEMPLINDSQEEIHFELRISKPGPHVLIITYVTSMEDSETSVLLIEANTIGKGKVTLYPCKYTSICRQVVTDTYDRVAVMNFQSNYVSIVLTGEPTSNIAIHSIVAIPYHRWSLDYIKPRSICVRKNGKCVQGFFPGAADSKKIEFESNNAVLEVGSRPSGIFDNATKLIYLNDKDAMVDIHAKVAEPGEYVFIVQYYQPDHPEFELDVLVQNGKFYEAKVSVPHCPSNSGCRSIVQQVDGNTRFQLIENFVITFKESSGNGIWLDYILVVPADQYNSKILTKIQFDQTKEFLKKCGNNHFYVNVTEEGFCKDSIFSLTANYNNHALPCNCDIYGTTSFECEKFGGQCPCKPNIIGRRCEICKTGYYGFPNCRTCACPSSVLCRPGTGECICPTRVTGERCHLCEPGTYGFDPIVGCEECNCSFLGVVDGNMQCDLFNGNCSCKENVVGRQCDKCIPGYSQFPHCEKCDCDVRGTTLDICDQYTAECFCKENVQGSACDVCKEGTFNIQASNEEGCTKCFCFGKTTRCASASLYRTHILDMNNWELVVQNENTGNLTFLTTIPQEINSTSIVIGLTTNDTFENVVYFAAPASYLGKKLTSYGGFLNYTVSYDTGPFGKAVSAADVILQGADTVLFFYGDEQPLSFTNFAGSVELIEANFFTPNRLSVTREQIMVVLENLQGIYIRATYWNPSIIASLSYVTIDVTTEQYSAQYSVPASSVEQCQCPPNYQGLSCEECAPGYYRVQSGPYGGYCVRCQCNGHAETCDVNTGVCHNCKNGTKGDHCEFCQQGYYGNATIGTPSDCLICACPLPTASNNFASDCEVNEEGNKISCNCLPGYYGARCETCIAGYYGNPEVYGDFCKPCECSGNIDTNQVDSCDSITGECLHCLNNTYGQACNYCAPGYFGDAVERKDCQSCSCNECGMEHCDSHNGQCYCQENVVGEQCDQCEENHYGFDSCEGCKPCDCDVASDSKQCDEKTGQCQCKPGVTGRKCDQCTPGYWNFGPDGCTSCGCNTGYSVGVSCNTTTGQCTCLPGVIGEKCDHCPYRHVLIPGQGCFACDSCTGDLLDVTDILSGFLNPVFEEYNMVAESYFTNQRLKFINDTVNDFHSEVMLLDPKRINFLPLQQNLSRLGQEVSSQKRHIDYAAEDSIKWKHGAQNTLNDMNVLEEDVIREINLVNFIVSEVQSLASNIELRPGGKIENTVRKTEEILKKIKEVSFVNFRDKAIDQADQANILVSEMLQYNSPVNNLTSMASDLNDKIQNISTKMDDLLKITGKAKALAADVEDLNEDNRIAAESGNFDIVKNITLEAEEDLKAGEQLNKKASQLLDETNTNIDILESNTLQQVVMRLNDTILQNDEMLNDLKDSLQKAHDHAESLYSHSLELDNLLTDTRNTNAVRAVSAYRDIEMAIQVANYTALNAVYAAKNATASSSRIEEKIRSSRDQSADLLASAEIVFEKTDGKSEGILQIAQTKETFTDSQNENNKELLDYIDKVLLNIPSQSSSAAHNAVDEVIKTVANITNAIQSINGTIDNIPNDLKKTKQLTKDTSESIRDISQAKKQLDVVNKIVPNINNFLNNLSKNQKAMEGTGNDLQSKIDVLKNKIANARELADRFKTGLTFYRNTTLELKNPESLPLLATSSKISLYFRTNKTNGFLFYLGNEEKIKLPRAKTHDFMALLIESGYPVLILDLGSGPTKVISNKFVSDNIWRQIIIDRTGKNVKLIVREDIGEGRDKEYETEKVLPGAYSIFNVDQEHSKLFVGGYPSSFNIQDAVTASSFEGEMEELVIGDIPVSFWNFVDGENNREDAMERDKLINFQPSTGYRFDKHGYAILSKRNSQISSDSRKFSIKLNFKTFADDGLIYLMGKGKQFLSLEMRDGQVLYQYDLDDGEISLKSLDKFNDGNWHNLEALRFEKIGVLKIDGKMVARDEAKGNTKTLLSLDYIYFGGYPPNAKHPYKPVTNDGFEGCIDDVVILDTSIDLSSNIQAFGVMPGCPVRFASLVSFEDNMPGYVKWNNVSASNFLQINLKFKTLANDGLIFYVTNPDQTSTSYMALVDGVLIFKSQGEELRTDPTEIKFNDNEWHVVTATHNESSLRLDIDDIKNYSTDSPPPSLHILYGDLYIGGIPILFQGSQNNARTPFVGCIGDATLNGIIINFANTTEKLHAFLGKCKGGEQSPIAPVDEPEVNVWIPLLPTESPDDTTEGATQINVVDIELEKEDEDEEPTLEGRGHHIEITTETIITSTPKPILPQTVDQCHLPYYPATDPDLENEWRFGTTNNSRLEYRSLNGRYRDYYDFQINIKTMSDNGIVFFASDLSKQDVIALYILDGKIHHKFDCGSGPAVLISDKQINDNQWHYIAFKRNKQIGQLSVDNETPIIGSSQGHTETINVNPPFFVGGVLPELFSATQSRIGLSTMFSGCLSNFMMNGQSVGEPTMKVGVIPCSKRIEPGLFFFPGNGSNLFKAMDRFTVGRTMDIQMDIKPRTTSGHLLSVHGKRDYLVLEMINGTVKFLVKTTKGSIETSFEPSKSNSLCDGNWHNVRAVKQKNAVLLSVDHKAAPIGIGGKNVAAVLSKHPIFIGGHPMLGRRLRGSTSQSQYVGCINNVYINLNSIHLGPERAYGRVIAGVCPTI